MEYYLKIAEMKVVKKPDILKTVVGSCIALCLWDKTTFSGGMVHIMMPESNGNSVEQKGKYADTAVESLLNEMIKKGCDQENLIARIVGGASMFNYNEKIDVGNIGEINTRIVKQYLNKFNISIKSEDTGGISGRRVVFDPSTGKMIYSSFNKNINK